MKFNFGFGESRSEIFWADGKSIPDPYMGLEADPNPNLLKTGTGTDYCSYIKRSNSSFFSGREPDPMQDSDAEKKSVPIRYTGQL